MSTRFGNPVSESVSAFRTSWSCVVAFKRTDCTTRDITTATRMHTVMVRTVVSCVLAGLSIARTMMGATSDEVVVNRRVMSAGTTVWEPVAAI